MTEISVKENFEKAINEIWDNPRYEEVPFRQYGYAIQDNIPVGGLLFIGLNPSRKDESNNRVFYNNEQEGGDIHRYFLKFQEISKQTGMLWGHFDLIFIRETDQQNIHQLFGFSHPVGTDFILEQLRIAEQVISQVKPQIIVVNNTMARLFLGKDRHFNEKKHQEEGVWMGWHFEFDEHIGTHRITNHPTLNNTPVFFTSMLTGQRALDKGSYERLIWHIRLVKKHLGKQHHP